MILEKDTALIAARRTRRLFLLARCNRNWSTRHLFAGRVLIDANPIKKSKSLRPNVFSCLGGWGGSTMGMQVEQVLRRRMLQLVVRFARCQHSAQETRLVSSWLSFPRGFNPPRHFRTPSTPSQLLPGCVNPRADILVRRISGRQKFRADFLCSRYRIISPPLRTPLAHPNELQPLSSCPLSQTIFHVACSVPATSHRVTNVLISSSISLFRTWFERRAT